MEKEVMVYFCFFVFCVINTILIYFNLNSKKFKLTIKFLAFLIFFSILATFIYKFNIIYIKSFFSLISLCSILILCCKEKIKNAFIYSVFIWVFGMMLDIACVSISSFIFKIFPQQIINNYSLYIMYGLTILLQIVYYALSRLNSFKKLMSNILNIIDKIKIGYIFNIYFVFVVLYLGILAFNNLGNVSFVLAILILGITLILVKLSNFMLSYKNYTLKQTNQILIDNNKFFIEINSETRKFKHNLIHKLNGVKAYGTKITNELINDIIEECNLLAKTDKEVEKLPAGINGLIYQKLYQKEYGDLKIMINNNINIDLYENLKARNYNRFCEVLGVALDNALEASSASKEKILYLCIEEDKESVTLLVQNTFNSLIDIDNVGDINYTTKSNGHGIGLFSILFSKEIKTKIRVINNIFETKITVPKLKKERY